MRLERYPDAGQRSRRAPNTTAGQQQSPGGGRQRKHGKENQQKHGEGARAGRRPPVLARGRSSATQKGAIRQVRRNRRPDPASGSRPQARRSDGAGNRSPAA